MPLLSMEKIRETKEKYVDACKKCGKKIIGYTKNEVKENMKRHKGSKACVKKNKK